MAPRIFISYRSADGADKATALARDLGQVFGDAQVFIDKDDLPGGSHWAQEVGCTLGARPVLLLLCTPQLFDAEDATGQRRLLDPADPVRSEVAAALAAGAELIPVLCDGVEALPADLPPPLDRLSQRTWRRLRAYDWAGDLQRLVEDLAALGVAPRAVAQRRRWWWRAGGALLALAGIGWAGWAGWAWRQARSPAHSQFLSGRWQADMGPDQVVLVLQQQAAMLTLDSEPMDIGGRADWADYRAFWQQRHGQPLDALRYRGTGSVQLAPGSALAIDLGFKLLSVPGDAEVDGGNLSLQLQEDGQLAGQRWLNSLQAEVPARLRRLR